MKLFIFSAILFTSLTLSAKNQTASSFISIDGTETVASTQIDRKKERKHKRMNNKRRKACHNWARKSYAG